VTYASEITVRAERKAGEIFLALPNEKDKGAGRPSEEIKSDPGPDLDDETPRQTAMHEGGVTKQLA
jgi:hypothetical protein